MISGKGEKENFPLGTTALHLAAHRGHCNVIQILFQNCRLDINTTNALGETALHYAASFGHLKIAKMLIDYGSLMNGYIGRSMI